MNTGSAALPDPVIASAAKRSRLWACRPGLLRRFAPRRDAP